MRWKCFCVFSFIFHLRTVCILLLLLEGNNQIPLSCWSRTKFFLESSRVPIQTVLVYNSLWQGEPCWTEAPKQNAALCTALVSGKKKKKQQSKNGNCSTKIRNGWFAEPPAHLRTSLRCRMAKSSRRVAADTAHWALSAGNHLIYPFPTHTCKGLLAHPIICKWLRFEEQEGLLMRYSCLPCLSSLLFLLFCSYHLRGEMTDFVDNLLKWDS